MSKNKNVTVPGHLNIASRKDFLLQARLIYKQHGLENLLEFSNSFAKNVSFIPVATDQRLTMIAGYISNEDPASAISVCDHALHLNPNCVAALLIKGGSLDRIGRHSDSVESMLSVISTPSSTPEDKIRAANLLVRLGEDEIALNIAKESYPLLSQPQPYLQTLLYISLRTADLEFTDILTAQIESVYREGKFDTINESPRTNLLWCANESYNIKVTSLWSSHALPHPPTIPRFIDPVSNRRLRIGYLSSDFRDHPTSRLVNGLLRNHDKSRVEVFMYCSGWNDGSAIRREIESHCDAVHTVAHLSNEDAAQLIRSHTIDVLVELNGPTRANRMGILAYRPAPVQIDYLGWPGSVGGRVVDYIIADNHTIPVSAKFLYPEKIITIGSIYQINDYASAKLSRSPAKKEYGLPEDKLILGMFNAINKVRSEVWNVWMEILRASPQSILWLLDPGPAARKLIGIAAKERGVNAKRIHIAAKLPQEAHLARLQLCDMMLDPWPYGGHTSTADALFTGVPVIAMKGTNFAGRVSGGLLKAAGLEHLVCYDAHAYIHTALDLLSHPEKILKLKQFIRHQVPKNDIFNALSKTRQLESAYFAAVDLAARALHPKNINADTDVLPLVSIVTVCKNRLHHLSQTLPMMCAQSNSEVIVVDYGCKQGTSQYVREKYPEVHLVEVNDDPAFCLSRARNIGASHARGKFILFIDADIFCREDLGAWIFHNAQETFLYESSKPRSDSLWGTAICSSAAFQNIGGYDEAFVGWGGEDDDLFSRLKMSGLKQSTFPSSYLQAIEHSDEERHFSGVQTKNQAHLISSTYRRIKYDVMKLIQYEPDLNYRKNLMKQVKEHANVINNTPHTKHFIEVSTPPEGPYRLSRTMHYNIKLSQ